MTIIKRFSGPEEFDKLLKSLPIVPSNTEIVDKTGVSKGSVSEIMNGKRTPTKKFIDKFKKGFKMDNDTTIVSKEKSPTENGEVNPKNIISILTNENIELKNTVSFLQENVKSLLEILKSK